MVVLKLVVEMARHHLRSGRVHPLDLGDMPRDEAAEGLEASHARRRLRESDMALELLVRAFAHGNLGNLGPKSFDLRLDLRLDLGCDGAESLMLPLRERT